MARIPGAKLLSAVACLVVAAGAAARPDDPPAKPPAELQGCWRLVSVEVGEQTRDPVGGGQPRWVVQGDKVLYGGEEVARLVADPSTAPRVLDLTFRDPAGVYEGVYAVEKGTLRVCLNGRADAKDRPSGFSTKDQADWRLLVFEREKEPPADPTEGLAGFAGVQLRLDPDAKAVAVDAALKGSPAVKAGLRKDDVILKVGGTAVAELDAAVRAVRQVKPGGRLVFRVSRGGKEMTVTVTVAAFPFRYVALLD
jgi:uncharacterized protein (TIGR03067 family)